MAITPQNEQRRVVLIEVTVTHGQDAKEAVYEKQPSRLRGREDVVAGETGQVSVDQRLGDAVQHGIAQFKLGRRVTAEKST